MGQGTMAGDSGPHQALLLPTTYRRTLWSTWLALLVLHVTLNLGLGV